MSLDPAVLDISMIQQMYEESFSLTDKNKSQSVLHSALCSTSTQQGNFSTNAPDHHVGSNSLHKQAHTFGGGKRQ